MADGEISLSIVLILSTFPKKKYNVTNVNFNRNCLLCPKKIFYS